MVLSHAQQDVIRASAAALQIVACAGSGKTEVLARRVVRYLETGVPAEAIVAFTFTQKAAAELKDRIERRAAEADRRFQDLPPCAAGLFVGTIHAYCLRILQEHGGAYELYEALTDEREWALLHRFARRLGAVDLFASTWPGQVVSIRRAVEAFRSSLAVIYNERIDWNQVVAHNPQLSAVARRYQELLARMQLLSFDQMIDAACSELKLGGRLREALRGRVRAVLVDEYQDLNRAQEELLEHLVALGAELTVVGDDDQAIYQWRGGDVSLFVNFPKRFEKAVRRELAENHRSNPGIVSLASRFAETIRGRSSKSMIPTRPDCGPCVELMVAGTAEEEAALVAKRIQGLLDRGHRPSDVAVLFRSVRTSARPLVDELRRAGIPAALVGRISLLDRPEMALLARVFVLWAGGTWRPDDELEVITPQRLARDVADLASVTEAHAGRIVAELERMGRKLTSNGVRDLIGTYLEMLKLIGLPTSGPERQRQEQGLGRLSGLLVDFEHAQRRSAPAGWLRLQSRSCAEEASEDQVITAVASSEAEPGFVPATRVPGQMFLARLRVFLEEFASTAAEEVPDTPTLAPDAVNIMTVHQSKGLEFPIVFVPSLVERRFPPGRMGEPKRWLLPADLFDRYRYEGREDDERRLFYVALTRGRELVCLSCFTQHRRSAAQPSRFLGDIRALGGRELLVRAGGCAPALRPSTAQDEGLTTELDFTQLLTYADCARKYYLRHVCQFQPPIAPELGFGRLLHHVVAELARRARTGQRLTIGDAEEILERAFYLPFAGTRARERMHNAARCRLTSFARRFGPELVRTIEPERRIEVPVGSARIRGRIDLLLRAPGGGAEAVELVDFKTAANRPPQKQHENQLRMYADALRTLGMDPVRLIIYDLDSERGGPIPVQQDRREVQLFRNQLQVWIEGIRAGNFLATNRSGCASCDFRALCQ